MTSILTFYLIRDRIYVQAQYAWKCSFGFIKSGNKKLKQDLHTHLHTYNARTKDIRNIKTIYECMSYYPYGTLLHAPIHPLSSTPTQLHRTIVWVCVCVWYYLLSLLLFIFMLRRQYLLKCNKRHFFHIRTRSEAHLQC